MGTPTAPLIVEAGSAYRDLDATSVAGIPYVKQNLISPLATGSFEDGMGARGGPQRGSSIPQLSASPNPNDCRSYFEIRLSPKE